MMRIRQALFFLAVAGFLGLSCAFVTNLVAGTPPTELTAGSSESPTGEPGLPAIVPEGPSEVLAPTGASLSTEGWPCYVSTWGAGFTFCYPPDAVLEDIPPDGARIELPVAEGTNLGSKWLDLIAIVGGGSCAPANFPSGDPVTMVTINGIEFLSDHGADAGAGSAHNWISYAAVSGDTCVRMTFTLGSSNAQMFDPPIPEFDRAAETAVFDAILSTFEWGG